MSRIFIPDYEYKERVARAAKMVADKGLDIMKNNSEFFAKVMVLTD